MAFGHVHFISGGEEILVFSLDESGNYQLVSGDDTWFDYDYVPTTAAGEVSRSTPVAWVQALKNDYASSGIDVQTNGFEGFMADPTVVAAPLAPMQPPEENKEFQNASDFQPAGEEVSLEEARERSLEIEKSLKRSKKRKQIIIGIILAIILAAASVYAFKQIFKEPGPSAAVFVSESSKAFSKGLQGNGEFNFSMLLSGDGKISTSSVKGSQTVEYKGRFFPGKLQLTPVSTLKTSTADDVENTSLLTARAKEIIWANGDLYIKTEKGWIGTHLQQNFNLLGDFQKLNKTLPPQAKVGIPPEEAKKFAASLTVRQTYAGPVLDGKETWELDTKLQSNSITVTSENENVVDANSLLSDFSIYLVSEQETMLPRVMQFTLEGLPEEWFPVIKTFATFKEAKVQFKLDFSKWGEAKPIVVPKKVRWISAKQLEKLSTPDADEIPGSLPPEIIQAAIEKATTGTTGAAGSSVVPEIPTTPGVPTP